MDFWKFSEGPPQLSGELASLHESGVRHTDLKPGNVLVDRRGEPWLVDFHAARRSRAAAPPRRLFRDLVTVCAAGREVLPAQHQRRPAPFAEELA